jgi:hypothetical protein
LLLEFFMKYLDVSNAIQPKANMAALVWPLVDPWTIACEKPQVSVDNDHDADYGYKVGTEWKAAKSDMKRETHL